MGTAAKLAGRRPGGAVEHGAEGADALIAEIERDLGDGFTAAQPTHGFEHPGLLPPRAEAQARLVLEAAGERARADVDRPAHASSGR